MKTSFFSDFLQSGTVISLMDQNILIGYGPRQWAQHLEELDANLPIFYFPDFFLEHPKTWFQHTHFAVFTLDDFKKHWISLSLPSLSFIQWHESSELLFQQMFTHLQDQIKARLLEKGVVYLFAYSSESMNSLRLQHTLHWAMNHLKNYQEFLYGYWEESRGILGMTPEILFSYKGRQLKTMALAGTSSQETPHLTFLTDKKLLEEHHLVVKDIQYSLQSFGRLQIGEHQMLELAHLKHLFTPIEVYLKEQADFKALIKALHPTPALGTFPRQKEWTWLKAIQKLLPRERYGAPAAVLHLKEKWAQCLVSIRNVQWDENGMRIGAGCGVVRTSQYQSEWEEIHLKLHAIKQLLGL